MRITPTDKRHTHRRRRGSLMLGELLFVLPILLMFMLGIVQFAMMADIRTQLLGASREGARVASSGGYRHKVDTENEVKATVHRVLGNGRLSRFSKINVTWTQDLPPDKTAGEPDWVEVEVDVRAGCVIPDVLGWLGFTLGNKKMVAATTMKQE
jgi:Flp pilus assembly protein TadG